MPFSLPPLLAWYDLFFFPFISIINYSFALALAKCIYYFIFCVFTFLCVEAVIKFSYLLTYLFIFLLLLCINVVNLLSIKMFKKIVAKMLLSFLLFME